MSSDSKETISFRLSVEHRTALDLLADSMERNRSDLITDAIRAYIDVQKWQLEEIAAAIKEANNGNFVSEKEVKKIFARLTK